MPAQNQDITHWAGDSAIIHIPVLDEDGNKVSLVGCSVKWWLAKGVTSTGTNVIVKKSSAVGEGIEIDLGTDVDTINITLDPQDTEGVKAGTYYHECEVINQNGDVSTVAIGKWTMKAALIPAPASEA